MTEMIVPLLSAFKAVFTSTKRFLIVYGGRGSGKSWHIGYKVVNKVSQGQRWVVARETSVNMDLSVYSLIHDIIIRLNLPGWTITKKEFRHESGGQIFFKGLRGGSKEDTLERMKSVEGVDGIWCEEAQFMSLEFLHILIPSIRKTGSQMIFSFNRYFDPDPVYRLFCINPDEHTEIVNVNYWQNKFLDPAERDRAEKMKKEDYDLWLHVYGGEPVSQDEKAVLSRESVMAAMERALEPVGMEQIGVDVARMGKDSTIFYKRIGHKITGFKEIPKCTIDELVDELEVFAEYDKDIPIKIDDTGLGGGVTDYMTRYGYNAIPVNNGSKAMQDDKYNNAISEMWFNISGIIEDLDIPDDDDLKRQLTTRLYKFDTKGRRQIESKDDYKKRMGESPDKADAFLLCFYEVQNKKTIQSKKVRW